MKPILSAFTIISFLTGFMPAAAQDTGSGVVRLHEWAPEYEHVETVPSDVLIDSLTLGYGYRQLDDRPYMAFALEWQPSAGYAPDSSIIVSMTVSADVHAEGRPVTRLFLPIDSLMLAAYPDLARLEYVDVQWEDLFEATDEETARQYFKQGFTLENLEILQIQFEPELEQPVLVADEPELRRGGSGRVIRTGGGIWIDIPIYREPPYRPRAGSTGAGRAEQPRGDNVGRGETRDRGEDRTNEGERRSDTKKKDSEDEEEDDDAELLPAALVGAAAIAAVAVAGGTVGYYGNMRHTPIGLMAGYVQDEGGVLLQAAINEAVINGGGPERGLARVISFYDLFNAPIQPALGLGLLVDEPTGAFEYEFSMSVGLVARAGPMLFLGGYDVMTGGGDFGVAYNFRYKR